jgi:hypothetical protein
MRRKTYSRQKRIYIPPQIGLQVHQRCHLRVRDCSASPRLSDTFNGALAETLIYAMPTQAAHLPVLSYPQIAY